MLIKKGDLFEIKTETDLSKIRNFLILNLNIASRKEWHELFSFYICVCFQLKNSLLIYPINSEKSESPDFILTTNDKSKIGVEVTELSPQSLKEAEASLAKMPLGSFIDMTKCSKDKKLREIKEKVLHSPNERLESAGLGDDGFNKLYLQYLIERLNKKLIKLNKENYQIFQSNQIIIDDTVGLPINSFVDLINELRMSFNNDCYTRRFDGVHIISRFNGKYLNDIFGHLELVNYQF
jgi:hypothetical protein